MAAGRIALCSVLIGTASACASRIGAGRYMTTATPVDVGLGVALCLAVDPQYQRGLWWWEPGKDGCASRSTGPDVFLAKATLSRPSTAGPVHGSFRLGTHSSARPFVDVQLVIEKDEFMVVETGSRARAARRNDLNVPERIR